MLPKRLPIVCLAVGEFQDLYVTRLESMLRRHMPIPFDLYCAVDRPRDLPASVKTIDVSGWPPPRPKMRPTTYKLSLFDPERVPFEEFLFLDTSMVIRKSMTELLEYAFSRPEDLVAVADWSYDVYNTSVMRIRQGDLLAIPRAYENGAKFVQRVPGDQDFVTSVIWQNGWDDRVATFPAGMVQNYGTARKAAAQSKAAGLKVIEQATIVKFNGTPKMHQLLDPKFRVQQAWRSKNPLHRNVWFWVRELRHEWR